MSVPVISTSLWPLLWAIFGGGAVVVVLVTVAIAMLTRNFHPTPHHRSQVPPSPHAQAPAREHALV